MPIYALFILLATLYPDIVRLYVLDGLGLHEVKENIEQREPGLKLTYVTIGKKPTAHSRMF